MMPTQDGAPHNNDWRGGPPHLLPSLYLRGDRKGVVSSPEAAPQAGHCHC